MINVIVNKLSKLKFLCLCWLNRLHYHFVTLVHSTLTEVISYKWSHLLWLVCLTVGVDLAPWINLWSMNKFRKGLHIPASFRWSLIQSIRDNNVETFG